MNSSERFGAYTPIDVRLGPYKLYLVGDPVHVDMLLKPARGISSNFAFPFIMKNVLGTPDDVLPIYSNDTDRLKKPTPGSRTRSKKDRIYFLHYRATHDHLTDINSIRMSEGFMEILSRNLSNDASVEAEWLELPNLVTFVQGLAFPAGIVSACGSFILTLNPTSTEDM